MRDRDQSRGLGAIHDAFMALRVSNPDAVAAIDKAIKRAKCGRATAVEASLREAAKSIARTAPTGARTLFTLAELLAEMR